MKTEIIKLSQITVNASNPRQIKDEKFTKLINSVLVFPEMLEIRPIVVDSTFVSLGGNMRYRALSAIAEMKADDIVKRLNGVRDYQKKTGAEKNRLTGYWEKWLDHPTATVIKASELSGDEQKAFIIKDNAGYGEWDYDMLSNEWEAEDLIDWGVDVWREKDADIDGFFDQPDGQPDRSDKEFICPHCGKDINKSAEEYEKDSDN
jgi:hypothetical protein